MTHFDLRVNAQPGVILVTVTVSVNIQQVTLGAKQCLNGPPSAAQTIIVPAELETGISRKYGIWE